jgi:hypothetical protein
MSSIWNVIKVIFMFSYVWIAGAFIVAGVNGKWWHWVMLIPLPLIYSSLKNVIMTKEISAASPKQLWEKGESGVSAGAWSMGHFWATAIIGVVWFFFVSGTSAH